MLIIFRKLISFSLSFVFSVPRVRTVLFHPKKSGKVVNLRALFKFYLGLVFAPFADRRRLIWLFATMNISLLIQMESWRSVYNKIDLGFGLHHGVTTRATCLVTTVVRLNNLIGREYVQLGTVSRT